MQHLTYDYISRKVLEVEVLGAIAAVASDGAYHTDAVRAWLLKKIDTDVHPHELEIGLFVSSEQIQSLPHNHCVHILDTLVDPKQSNLSIIVMPYLRAFDDPEFQTFGEVVACIEQLIEVRQSYCFASHDIELHCIDRDCALCTSTTLHTGMCSPSVLSTA